MSKRYGIRITMPDDDPMRASHLLGEDWESFRWFDSAEERDRILLEMRTLPPFYRRGDAPNQVLEPVEEELGD